MSLRGIVTSHDLIYVDGNQDYASLAKQDGRFHVCKLGWHTGATPRSCDVAWWQDDKLFAMEEKKPADLAGSLRARRLQRELRGIVDEADVPVLGLRTEKVVLREDPANFDFEDFYTGKNAHWPMLEVSKWTVHGLTVFLPSGAPQMLGYLVRLRDALTSAGARSILAGTDQRRRTGGSPFQQRVRRLFDGVGPVAAQKLDDYFQGNFMLAINARPMFWRAAGAHKGIIKQLEEIQEPYEVARLYEMKNAHMLVDWEKEEARISQADRGVTRMKHDCGDCTHEPKPLEDLRVRVTRST